MLFYSLFYLSDILSLLYIGDFIYVLLSPTKTLCIGLGYIKLINVNGNVPMVVHNVESV